MSEQEKATAAIAAAELLRDDMRVGLGTGSTVAHLLPAIAARSLSGLRCVATSPATEASARELGLAVVALDELGELDIAIDGADQIDPQGWLVKGGGAATRGRRSSPRRRGPSWSSPRPRRRSTSLQPPVPLELLRFGVESTLRALAPARARDVARESRRGSDSGLSRPRGRPGGLSARPRRNTGCDRARPVRARACEPHPPRARREVERRRGGKSD